MGKKSFLLGALAASAAIAEAASTESSYRTPVKTEYYVRVDEDAAAKTILRNIFDRYSYSDAIELIDDIATGSTYGYRITTDEARTVFHYIRKVGAQYISPADRACKLYKLVK